MVVLDKFVVIGMENGTIKVIDKETLNVRSEQRLIDAPVLKIH